MLSCAKGWVPVLAPKVNKEKEVQNPFSKYVKGSLGKRDKNSRGTCSHSSFGVVRQGQTQPKFALNFEPSCLLHLLKAAIKGLY